jgi:hypothetical protein
MSISRDLPTGDRPDGEDAWQDLANCPECEASGRPGYPLVKQDERWWCRRHRGFVELPEAAPGL